MEIDGDSEEDEQDEAHRATFIRKGAGRPKGKVSWDRIVFPALKKYKELHGHFDMPSSFTVPISAEWPSKLHGLALGKTVSENSAFFISIIALKYKKLFTFTEKRYGRCADRSSPAGLTRETKL